MKGDAKRVVKPLRTGAPEERDESKEEKGDYYRSEISNGMFARTITLPSSVNADKAKSEFKDGVLKLALPKVENAKRRTNQSGLSEAA